MEAQTIPEFMKKYYEGGNPQVKASLGQLAKQYENDKATFLQTTYVQKKNFEADWNKKMGRRDNLTPEQALAPMQEKYREFAELKAKEHGYKEPEAAPDQEVKAQPQAQSPDVQQQRIMEKKQAFLANMRSMNMRQTNPKMKIK